MTTTVGEDLARVTVISPTRRIDLALPGSTTLGELLPNIIRFAGFDGATTQEAIHAWVLQRLGEDPLDPNKKVSSLNIRDGETLHLRQRESGQYLNVRKTGGQTFCTLSLMFSAPGQFNMDAGRLH